MQSRLRGLALVALLLATVVAGCLDGDEVAPKTGPGAGVGTGNETGNLTGSEIPSIEGFVLDEGRMPLADAHVTVQNADVVVTTDDEGHYEVPGLVPNEMYVLIAEVADFEPKPQQVVVVEDKIVRLDFILEPVPKDKPYDEVIERRGLISCQLIAGAGHDHGGDGTEYEHKCGGLEPDPNARQSFDVTIGPKAASVVVEVYWESIQPFSDFMMVTVEAVGYGELDKTFGSAIGASVLRIEVAQSDVQRYYADQGGLLRLTVDVHYEDDDEQAIGVAFASQQPFTARVSNFYVLPHERSYTAFPDA